MSDSKLQAFRAFDWEGDERWRAHRLNLEIPAGKEALEVKFRAKWYKRVVDPDFDVDSVKPAAPAAPTSAPAAPKPQPAPAPRTAAATPPPPTGGNSAAGASTRGGPTAELVLLVAHVAMLVLAVVALQPLSRPLSWQAYFLFCRTALVATGYKAYLRFGLPSFRPFPQAFARWMQQVTQSTEFFHLMVASLLSSTPQLWVGMVPLALGVLNPALRTLGARFGAHPLWARYGQPAKALVDRSQAPIQQLSANLEIALGFQFIFVVLTGGLRVASLAYVFWQQLRMRYWSPESRPYHMQAWAAINARVQPLLAAVPTLQRYVDYPVRWFQQPGQQQPHRQ